MAEQGEFDAVELSMSVTVDISGMDDQSKEIFHALADIYEQNFQEIAQKNRDYSWSFLTTGEKLSASGGTPFDNHTRSQAYGLLTRSGDKRERLIENIYVSVTTHTLLHVRQPTTICSLRLFCNTQNWHRRWSN